jgi:hypothetical protein
MADAVAAVLLMFAVYLIMVVRNCLMVSQLVTLWRRQCSVFTLMYCCAFLATPTSSIHSARCRFVVVRVCQVEGCVCAAACAALCF